MLKKLAPYIFALSLLILGLAIGFFFGKRDQPYIEPKTAPLNSISENSLYSSQTASIRGIITKIDGETLTIKNLNNQVTAQQQISTRLIVSKATLRPDRTATPSSNISSIELNKEAFIQLEMIGGRYQVTSIQYTPPAPSLPPISVPRP